MGTSIAQMEEATASNRISLVRFQPNDLKRGVTARLPSAPLIVYNVLRLCEVAATQNLIINRDVSAAILQNRC